MEINRNDFSVFPYKPWTTRCMITVIKCPNKNRIIAADTPMSGDDLSSVTVESSRGGAVKATHMEARCCSGSWTCSPRSERSSSTDRYQRPSGPLGRKGEMNGE